MRSWIIAGLVALVYLTGAGNYVGALIYRANGTWSTAYVDGTGEAVAATHGPGVPLPDWVPRPAGAVIVTASRSFRGPAQRQFATLDIATRMSKADLDRFYDERLAAEGFVIVERDDQVIDPRLGHVLGVEGIIVASHSRNDWRLKITIRSAEGWILPSRMVQLAWWDWPMPMGSNPQSAPPPR